MSWLDAVRREHVDDQIVTLVPIAVTIEVRGGQIEAVPPKGSVDRLKGSRRAGLTEDVDVFRRPHIPNAVLYGVHLDHEAAHQHPSVGQPLYQVAHG